MIRSGGETTQAGCAQLPLAPLRGSRTCDRWPQARVRKGASVLTCEGSKLCSR